MNDHALERLTERLDELEERVSVLEHPSAARKPDSSPHAEILPEPQVAAVAPAAQSGNMFPVMGRAMLGIAGAYLLRAVAETSSSPKLAVASVGIVYAFLWLLWAVRAHRRTQFARTLYATTSALILTPMLWELTIRFKVLPTAVTAGVLCAFALVALAPAAIARTRSDCESAGRINPVLRIACIASAGLALALAIASHEALPFIVVLLTLSAICEFSPRLDRMPEIRTIVALAADVTIWIQIYTYFSQQTTREGYPMLGESVLLLPGIVLFLIFAGGVGLRTALLRKQITAIETVQTTIAFLLAAVSVADFGPASRETILGIASLVLAVACSAAVFLVFAGTEQARNRGVFSAWCAALLLCGFWLCLPAAWAAACVGSIAVTAIVAGGCKGWIGLEWYGAVFVISAAVGSGLLTFAGSALAGNPTGAPTLAVWFAAACAVACYATTRPRTEQPRSIQALHLGLAALAAGAVTAFAAQSLAGLLALRVVPGAHHLAFIRTLTLCAAALALAFLGAHWRRRELTRLGYVMLALVAVKLVAEDLRHGHLEYIAGSIFLFAVTLIAAPRVARVSENALQ